MPPPLDAALIAAQSYKLRPTAPATARPKQAVGTDQGARPASTVPGRREAPSVSVSLSAEALAILNGEERRTGPVTRDPYSSRGPAQPEPEAQDTVAAADPAEEVFQPMDATRDDAGRYRREAPFAHLNNARSVRIVPPGSRLDISV